MAYSYVRYSGNGSTTNYTFSFPTISQDHIKVRVNGTLVTAWSFLSASTIQFAVAPANAAVIEIRRETPKESAIVNFTDGSVLLERDLDLLATWQLYVAQETEDDLEDTIRTDSQGRFDANNKRIINVADPVNAQDAVTKTWAETAMSSQLAQATSQATAAAGSATAAAGSATAAATSASNASTSASNAATSASGASTSATAAAGSATAAANSATAAGTSATNANSSAVAAASSATASANSATASANSATAAAASYDSFDDRYLGAKAVAPTVDNDGNTLLVGATFWDTVSSQMFVWAGSQWKPTFLTGNAVRSLIVATAGQTIFTVPTYVVAANTLQVFVNGIKVLVGPDYTETNQNTITFASGLTVGDEVEAIALQPYAIGTTGAESVSFQQTGSTAIRTVDAKLKEAVSVKDFGAVGNGVADDTAAIQAAINASSAVYFPPGLYNITSELTLSGEGVVLLGASRYKTIIRQMTLNAKILNISNIFCGAHRIGFLYGGVPLAGATVAHVTSGFCSFSDLIIRSCHTGFAFVGTNAVAGKITDFEIFDYEAIGILMQNTNDLFVSNFIMNAGNEARGTLGGIRLQDKAEAFICSDGDILMGQYSMTTDASVVGLGSRPAYNNFTNVFFDSAVNSTLINKCIETEFVGCWFSGGRSAAGKSGVGISQSQSIRFTNTRFFNCGAQGALVNASATDVTFTACSFESNSVTAGAGVAHGLHFADNTKQFQVIGCKASNGLYTGTQAYGIFIGAGCDEFVIRDNNVFGNMTGPILDGSSANANKTIHGNIGYRTSNTGQATIASGTTSIAVTHGLSIAPRTQDIMLTRGGGNAGSTDLYVSGITSTQFTINTAAAPVANMPVNWMSRCSGA